MGSYGTLSLGPLELASVKNRVDFSLMWHFRPSDKRVELIDRTDRERLAEYVVEYAIDEYVDGDQFTCVEYRCTALEARDRLELRGFTCEVAKSYFDMQVEAEIQECERMQSYGLSHFYREKLQVLRSLTFDKWQEGFSCHVEALENDTIDEWSRGNEDMPRIPLFEYHHCGFPGFDYRHFTRIAIDMLSPKEHLVYDLTELAHGGWIDAEDEFVAKAEASHYANLQLSQRVIVLTEGETDRQILQRSLSLLYPHLEDYFHFFDFTGKKVGGGVGELANLVRAFAAADVQHRILALFDNDTASRAALTKLDVTALPKNISVRHYPQIDLARRYPTEGPTGKSLMNVNGLAGSIELYLGEDAIRDTNGALPPVQWTGYNPSLSSYQGEVRDKRRILKEFKAKLSKCEADPEQVNSYDWRGIKAIIDDMFGAFHSIDAQEILDGALNE